jgi:acid stress-induced BolA-like protein IbaG/YrbA
MKLFGKQSHYFVHINDNQVMQKNRTQKHSLVVSHLSSF